MKKSNHMSFGGFGMVVFVFISSLSSCVMSTIVMEISSRREPKTNDLNA
jgi:hypothetical protein